MPARLKDLILRPASVFAVIPAGPPRRLAPPWRWPRLRAATAL